MMRLPRVSPEGITLGGSTTVVTASLRIFPILILMIGTTSNLDTWIEKDYCWFCALFPVFLLLLSISSLWKYVCEYWMCVWESSPSSFRSLSRLLEEKRQIRLYLPKIHQNPGASCHYYSPKDVDLRNIFKFWVIILHCNFLKYAEMQETCRIRFTATQVLVSK